MTEVDCQAYRSQIVACEGLPAHAHWNTASSITQIFNGTQFLPTITGIHDVAGSMAACYFVCDAGYAWDGTQCEATVVALCGDDHGTSSLSAPDALCAAGAPSIVAQTGTTWDWTCLGAGGGADAVCHTVRSICGDATPQSGEQCDDGNTLNLDGCSSTCQLESPVNGACGASEGTFFTSQPLTELCDAGTPTAVTGSGPWSWTCLGQSLGAHDTCQTLSTGGGG